MYFQSLENLHSNLSEIHIEKFDSWLAGIAPIYKKKINPQDFSIINKFDINLTMKLFDLGVESKLLKPKIIVVDDEGTPFGTFYQLDQIPLSFDDYENNRVFYVEEHNMEMWYELIASPKSIPVLEETSLNNSESNFSKPRNIVVSDLKRTGAGATLDALGGIF